MSNSAFQELLDLLEEHNRDGYKVPAVRVSEEKYRELLEMIEFIVKEEKDHDIVFEHDEAIGMIAATEIIVDDSISGIVAEDVRGMWRNE